MARPTVLEFEKMLGELEESIRKMQEAATREKRDVSGDIELLNRQHDDLLRDFFGDLTAWDNVLLARHPQRPYTLDYLPLLADEWVELHGDRLFGDDGALIGGLARMDGQSVVLIGQQKGRDLKERQKRNFGYVRPEGYRKALRLMQMAERFGMPVVSLVDTPGADPNVSSEERGISEAIAHNLREMAVLNTPTVAVIIGEGGSGGALGIAVCDRVLMLQHSIYSVIAPEGCASIIWRDPTKGAEAAAAMRVTAQDALALGLIDEVVPEPTGGAHHSLEQTSGAVREAILRHLHELKAIDSDSPTHLIDRRYQKLRSLGRFVVLTD